MVTNTGIRTAEFIGRRTGHTYSGACTIFIDIVCPRMDSRTVFGH
jgi:hypothetical protein